MTPRASLLTAEEAQELAAVAVAIAKELIAVENSKEQRQNEADQPQLGKHDVEEPQREIQDGPEPEVVVPMALLRYRRLLHGRTSRWIVQDGHSLAQRPQPTQRSASTCAKQPCQMAMAPRGHTSAQLPQATHVSRRTTA